MMTEVSFLGPFNYSPKVKYEQCGKISMEQIWQQLLTLSAKKKVDNI